MTFKHQSCSGCPLSDTPSKFILPSGPYNSPICIIGEAGGGNEGREGQPFIGPAGHILNTALKMLFMDRDAVRVANVLSCQPPGDYLVGAPYEYTAINHCIVHREPVLSEPHRVFVAAGATATRTLLGLPKNKFDLDNWQSTVNPTEKGWIIPMYHPAYLFHRKNDQGGYAYFPLLLHALQLAKEVAEKGWEPDLISTVVDPSPEEYASWAAPLLEGSPDVWLPVDVETPEKMKGTPEDTLDDPSYQILRINFAYHPDEGLTVPWSEEWHATTRKLLESPNPKIFWHADYDVPRLRAAGFRINGKILDFMLAWHMLRSDLPKGLGFVAPLYSKHGAWKHLSGINPGEYAAIDPAQTLRCANGIARDLTKAGRWNAWMRDMYTLNTVALKPAEQAGVGIDPDALRAFSAEVTTLEETLAADIQRRVPAEVCPLEPAGGWKKRHSETDVEKTITDKKTGASLVRYYRRGQFNPDSSPQVLAYLKHMGLQAGRGKKGSGESADKLALEKLAKKDPVCAAILKRRPIGKINSTYCTPTLTRITAEGSDGRLHTTFTRTPRTQRLASVDPNLQNVVARGSDNNVATGFRRCIIPAPGYVFVDADFAAIEAVVTGWLAKDPAYIRLAWAGVHDYMVGAELKGVPPVSKLHEYTVRQLKALLKPFKAHKELRERKKRTVHGVSYGQTAYGQAKLYPHLFPSMRAAQHELDFFFSLCPSIPKLQTLCREMAHKRHYLGHDEGSGHVMPGPLGTHPFEYMHPFWNVYAFDSRRGEMGAGQDFNAVVAFGGQSIAAGIIYHALLALHNPEDPDYVGDMDADHPDRGGKQWFMQEDWTTPFRLQVHDSALFEVKEERKDLLIERITRVMERVLPMMPCPPEWGLGPYLKVGVAVKTGRNWGERTENNPQGMEEIYSSTL